MPDRISTVNQVFTAESVISEPLLFKEMRLYSAHLKRLVKLTLLQPAILPDTIPMSVLLVFDGQDFPALRMQKTLEENCLGFPEKPLLVVGIHANKDRIYEYGTASQPDYAYRGNKAANTTHFVTSELMPYLKANFTLSKNRSDWSVAGFSLSGLMAMDIAWHHSEYFSQVGVFSGSFWWRQRALEDDYEESDRIMHSIIRNTPSRPPIKFWFQTGTRDEESDRDNDGIIDSIDDTLDLIAELERKGFAWGNDIRYEEVQDGEHHPSTWAKVFPDFLHWVMKMKS
ncbi:alpha/beta hydrolase [Persicitalea sp.]|uniref:alpha/beta hydrolase n=1 Tax=Persicitalea sp. TaxID=3100273 RepID=UPI00359403C5